MPFPFCRQTLRIGAGEIPTRHPHVRNRRHQCPASGKTARRGTHLRTQRHNASLPRHSPGEINVFKQRHVLKTSDALEDRSANENDLVAVKPTETPRTPFAEQARQAQEPRTALEARSEEHTSELQSQSNLVCRLLLEKTTPVALVTPPPPRPASIAFSSMSSKPQASDTTGSTGRRAPSPASSKLWATPSATLTLYTST